MADIFQAGGPVMYPLLLCSIITLTITIDRALFWLRHYHYNHSDLTARLNKYAAMEGLVLSGCDSDLIKRVLIEGLESNPSEATLRMRQAAVKEINTVTCYHSILNTMVSFTPMLGIFGTVLGIIDSFRLLGDSSLTDPVAASAGLAQALITTAFGLAIAMWSLIAIKFFESQYIKLQFQLETCCTEIEMLLGVMPQTGVGQ